MSLLCVPPVGAVIATLGGAWAALRKTFAPPVDISECGALGVWVHGDGKGELLNFQLTNPLRFWPAWAEHYLDVDFRGWRYVELHLRERDADRFGDYIWPYGGRSAVFRAPLIRSHTSALAVYYNDLPPGDEVECFLGPVRALPVVKVKLGRPALSVGSGRLELPVTLESGQYLEMESPADIRVYDERGALIDRLTLPDDPPRLEAGENRLAFTCTGPAGYRTRAKVSVVARGEPFLAEGVD